MTRTVEQARKTLERAEDKANQAAGSRVDPELLDARAEAAANRLQTIERYGTETPEIVTVVAVHDHGPCDDGPTAHCPHCGAGGRYIHVALLPDGGRIAAMAGCIQLYPQSAKYARASKLVQEAYKRERAAADDKRKLAGWWDQMLGATEALADGRIDVDTWHTAINEQESKRQAWLNRNGYGKQRYRR